MEATWFAGKAGIVGVGWWECRVSSCKVFRCMACRYLL